MRCFVFFVGVPRSVDDSLEFTYREIIEEAQVAEDLGYYAIWVGEHHAAPHYGVAPNPILLCAAIAARTKRIRIGTGCTVLPLYNPVRVAEDISMLDAISNGRVELALCRGSHSYEYDSLGVSFEESKHDYQVGLGAVKKMLLEAAEGRSHGRTPNGTEILSIPPTTQRPLPPLWTTCTSVASMGLALDNELRVAMPSFGTKAKIQEMRRAFEAECRKRSLDPAKQRYGLSVYAWASEKTEEIQQTEDAWTHINNMATQLRDGHNSLPREHSGFTPPSLEEFRDANLVGSDARLREQVAFYEANGITDLIVAFPRSFPSATIRANMARVAVAIGLTTGSDVTER